MTVDRRQLLTGAAFATIATLGATKAQACSRQQPNPLTTHFWNRLWQEKVTWPNQARVAVQELLQGILKGQSSSLKRALAPDAYLFLAPTAVNIPQDGRLLIGEDVLIHLASRTRFEKDFDLSFDLMAIQHGNYIVAAQFRGSGFRRKRGDALELYGMCGEDPTQYRTQPFYAQITVDWGGSGLVKRVVVLG